MKFSVIIPVYNRPDEVEELLESLSKQTNHNFELIIVEDGSEDKCKHILKKTGKGYYCDSSPNVCKQSLKVIF